MFYTLRARLCVDEGASTRVDELKKEIFVKFLAKILKNLYHGPCIAICDCSTYLHALFNLLLVRRRDFLT